MKHNKFTINQILSNSLMIYRNLSNDPSYNPYLALNKEKILLIKEVSHSGWNPPTLNRQTRGDFFYVRALTYESEILHITAFCKGFFVNKSTDEKYDPNPKSKAFLNLIELFDEFSPIFQKNYEKV